MYDTESPIDIKSSLVKFILVGGFWKTEIINLNNTLKLNKIENTKK